MKKTLFLLFFPLLVGCATTPKKSSNLPEGFIIDGAASSPNDGNGKDWKSRSRTVDPNREEIERSSALVFKTIDQIQADLQAQEDGFIPRFSMWDKTVYVKDYLVSYDSKIYGRYDFLELVKQVINKERPDLSNNFIRQVILPIENSLLIGEDVSIIVIPKVNTSPENTTGGYKNIEEMDSSMLCQSLLSMFANTISIVDRSKLDYILKEKKLSLSGLMEKEISEIGTLVNANQMLFIERNVDLTGKTPTVVKISLIRTNSGEVMGTYSEILN